MVSNAPAALPPLPPTVYRTSRAKTVRLVAGCLAFVAAGVLLVVTGESVGLNAICILFFGLGAVVLPISLILWGPELVLDADGLECRQLGRIHWAEIRSAEVWEIGHQRWIELTGHYGATFPPRPSRYGTWMARHSRRGDVGTARIRAAVLPVDVWTALDCIRRHHPGLMGPPLVGRPGQPAPADEDPLLATSRTELLAAFPPELAEDVHAVVTVMPHTRHRAGNPFGVLVSGRPVAIPARIHHDEPPAEAVQALTPRQRKVLHCLYSRHGDGWIRQRHLEQFVDATDPWVVPFVVQLAGEYVLPILVTIHRSLADRVAPGTEAGLAHGRFLADNPAFFALTAARVRSYWNCYHRDAYPDFGDYPGCAVLDLLRAAAELAGPSAVTQS
ncbi:STM3941 family protein [Kitasatospora sp. NPDC092948]|uniref:STM3941 family protein n=1 Tax=Kitasatospora sp. NPDC092948 TaxID=3364088 RepID=UPI00380D79B2